jgi:hypothetical protein
MDIKVTSTGKIFYQIDNAVAALLMEALPASFERVVPHPKPEPAAFEARWAVGLDNGGYYRAEFRIGSRTEFYLGPPSQLAAHFQQMGVVVPEHVIEKYTPLWRPRDIEHPAVHAAYWAEYQQIHEGSK